MSSFMVVVSNCQVGFQGYSVVPAEMCFQFHLAKLIAENLDPQTHSPIKRTAGT